ncbi:MAG: threonine synthase [Planctomycetota bacterium]
MSTQAVHPAFQRCVNPDCAAEYPVDRVLTKCPKCGALLDVVYAPGSVAVRDFSKFERRSGTVGPRGPAGGSATKSALNFSGVWRFRDLLPFYRDESEIVSIGEGRTNLQRADRLGRAIGFECDDSDECGRFYLQYEGYNPSGSFKDNGMAAAFTHARMVGATRVACASTGNTSASLALYASLTGLHAFVFIGDGKIAFGKLSQALDYGATTLQIAGDFDACMSRVKEVAQERPELGVYLVNSVNPFRLEGQKTVMYRVLEGLDWRVPDWIVVPGGNLGNSSAFGKAFMELRELGLIDRVPRLAVINAHGARTLDRLYNEHGLRWDMGQGPGRFDHVKVAAEYTRMDAAGERADTVASAIEINRPVNLSKCLRALHVMDGVVHAVDDDVILEHKALVGRYGFGCEPASGASVAGARRLRELGVIRRDETVVCVLTGHQLKDPDVTVGYHTGMDTKPLPNGGEKRDPTGLLSNQPIRVANDLDAIIAAMGVKSESERTLHEPGDVSRG